MSVGRYTPAQVAARQRKIVLWLVVAPLAGLVLHRLIFKNDFWALTMAFALCSGLVGMSINVLTGYAGQISLGHAALYGTGAYATAYLTTLKGVPFFVSLPLATAVTGIVVLLVGFPALRIRGLNLAIVTLGFQFLMNRIVFRLPVITGGEAAPEVKRPAVLGSVLSDQQYLLFVLACVVLVLSVDRNLLRTKAGRAFLAIREDEQVAASFGVDVARFKLLAFGISGCYAGLAGGLFAGLITFVNPEVFDYQPSLEFLAYAVIGGLGSRWGTMIGAMIPVFFQQVAQGLRSWGVVLGGVLLVLTLVRYRGGLAEQGRELKHIFGFLWAKVRGGKAGHGEQTADEAAAPSAAPAAPITLRRTLQVGRSRRAPAHLLDVREVAIRFGGVQALDGVSLEVRDGEIVGIMGPNGAGKTTLFNCISGFAKPQQGRITIRGRDASAMPPHERAMAGLGRTFQNIGLVKSETVLHNLVIAQHAVAPYGPTEGLLRTAAVQRAERKLADRAAYVAGLLEIEDVLDQRVHDLPHGRLKLVELGAALVTGPQLLLLDEPSSGMSPGESDELGGLLERIRDTFDVTILMIEHHVPLVLAVADYVYVLNFGQILAEGEASGIASHPEVIAAYLGESDEELITLDG